MSNEIRAEKSNAGSALINVQNIKLIKKLLPAPLVRLLIKVIPYKYRTPFKNLSTQEVFTKIYEEGYWDHSERSEGSFNSGTGSRDLAVVNTYVNELKTFLSSFDKKPNVLDLGCGDFFVGSKVRPLCNHYIACDIVEPLINHNKQAYKNHAVEFRVLDITKDELPDADVVFIRQVLQHLSNDLILEVIPKITSKYQWLVLTEHVPNQPIFTPNLDIPTGPRTRHNMPNAKSGVVLTQAPFNMSVLEEKILCEALEDGSIVRTTLYRFKLGSLNHATASC